MSGKESLFRRPEFELTFRGSSLRLGRETKLMAVLNVTPDSFSDGGRFFDPGRAAAQALRLQAEGAHILDIGGESSRPGSKAVTVREEIRRIRPVLKRLSGTIQIPISVDTYKYDVAMMALDEGASIVNDITALGGRRKFARLIARYDAGLVLMHMRGNPATMQKNTAYKDLFGEIGLRLREAADLALSCGVRRSNLAVDPGFGFGKSAGQNLQLLSSLHYFSKLRLPVLAGLSRKSFIGHLLAPAAGGTVPGPDGRLYGSLAAAAAALERGVHILRVHEVLPHKHLAVMMDAAMRPESFK